MDPIGTARDAELKQLTDIPIDDVLALLDGEPGDYRSLYYRWEKEQWAAGTLDLTEDRVEWPSLAPGVRSFLTAQLGWFGLGADRATRWLIPFVDAAPSEEQQVFLSTQLVDSARHSVLFDRIASEIFEDQDVWAHLPQRTSEGFKRLVEDLMPDVAQTLLDGSTSSFATGLALEHLVAVDALGLTLHKAAITLCDAGPVLRGIRTGLAAAVRDSTRHVAFTLRFLADATDRDRSVGETVRSALIDSPVGWDLLREVPCDGLPFTTDDLVETARARLDRSLMRVGVDPVG
ncbi:MAG TPA: hypothetical protein VFK89_10710 [Actinomycetota bacterium]|nr:hypothetical protein [Actinomycetota bacterium]